ncbi:MAG: hypothetical protein ACYC6J_06510 [Coriobacteriia bacterium]
MPVLMVVAAGIVVAASAAFLVIGMAYGWDMTAEGYGLWTRVTGVVAVMALAGVAAWSEMNAPLAALAIIVGGIVLSVVYVFLHRRLTERVREMLGRTADSR